MFVGILTELTDNNSKIKLLLQLIMLAKMNIGVEITKACSRLPWKILFGLSSLTYIIVFKLIGYRRKVVISNLKNAFPDKSPQEITIIAHHFFRFLADMMVETVKAISMSKKEWSRAFNTSNIDLPNSYYEKGKSTITVLGHYGNWEYLVSAYSRDAKHTILGVYKPLHNSAFEKLFASYRCKFGMVLVPLSEAYETIEKYLSKGELISIMLIGDQTPSADRGYWMDFLNQDTPVFKGAEKLAVKYDLPVIYASLDRTHRGRYTMSFKTLFEHPKDTMEGEITEIQTKTLEAQIMNKPHLWLWSHKRWKHKRPKNTPERFISKRYPGK